MWPLQHWHHASPLTSTTDLVLQTQDFGNVMQTAFTQSLPGSAVWAFMVSGTSADFYVQVCIFCQMRGTNVFNFLSQPLYICCCRRLLTRPHRISTGSALGCRLPAPSRDLHSMSLRVRQP